MKRHLAFAAKVLASAAILWVLVSHVEPRELGSRLSLQQPLVVPLLLVLIVAQYLLGTLRWQLVCAALGAYRPSTRQGLAWTGMGMALSQVLPSSIGGDAYRVVALARHAGIAAATRTVVAERVAGLLTLAAIAFPLSILTIHATQGSLAFIAYALLSGAVLLGALFAGALTRLLSRWTANRLVRLVAADFAAMYAKATLVPVFTVSLGIHALSLGMVVCLDYALGLDEIAWWQAALAVPGALLASAVPISIGGWGVREATMVFALSAFGVAAAPSLALSISFGLALSVAGVVGIALWFYGQQGARAS